MSPLSHPPSPPRLSLPLSLSDSLPLSPSPPPSSFFPHLSPSPVRNVATETVQQELLFVGQESGKLLAMRDLVGEV